MTQWVVSVFEKHGDEAWLRDIPATAINAEIIRELWLLSEDDPVIGACYEVDDGNLREVQKYVTESLEIERFYYQICDAPS